MTDQPAPARHGALFELLRQQVASDSAGRRLAVKRRTGDEAQQISRVLTGALRSWDQPAGAASESAPTPRGDDEFFRAIRTG